MKYELFVFLKDVEVLLDAPDSFVNAPNLEEATKR